MPLPVEPCQCDCLREKSDVAHKPLNHSRMEVNAPETIFLAQQEADISFVPTHDQIEFKKTFSLSPHRSSQALVH
ncbi:hypothetical protein KIN20_020751 [Parelaphostrongylus tenuis]|uniref:Uncharacterized protein n=1 Tax=Parelaphostrongylus tenuis TaxID=148309 RepID=A0AAD5MT89_PARTN|nr:hypothetical protein KIN20_020751 [Parelaphostrongylus tenuis]